MSTIEVNRGLYTHDHFVWLELQKKESPDQKLFIQGIGALTIPIMAAIGAFVHTGDTLTNVGAKLIPWKKESNSGSDNKCDVSQSVFTLAFKVMCVSLEFWTLPWICLISLDKALELHNYLQSYFIEKVNQLPIEENIEPCASLDINSAKTASEKNSSPTQTFKSSSKNGCLPLDIHSEFSADSPAGTFLRSLSAQKLIESEEKLYGILSTSTHRREWDLNDDILHHTTQKFMEDVSKGNLVELTDKPLAAEKIYNQKWKDYYQRNMLTMDSAKIADSFTQWVTCQRNLKNEFDIRFNKEGASNVQPRLGIALDCSKVTIKELAVMGQNPAFSHKPGAICLNSLNNATPKRSSRFPTPEDALKDAATTFFSSLNLRNVQSLFFANSKDVNDSFVEALRNSNGMVQTNGAKAIKNLGFINCHISDKGYTNLFKSAGFESVTHLTIDIAEVSAKNPKLDLHPSFVLRTLVNSTHVHQLTGLTLNGFQNDDETILDTLELDTTMKNLQYLCIDGVVKKSVG